MNSAKQQQGLALLMLVFVMALVVIAYIVSALDATGIKQARDRKTAAALAEAKAALIGFSVSQSLPDLTSLCGINCPRPGDFPCPDTDNNGFAQPNCGNAAGTTGQANRLGRLPWRTLGLPDLRDGDGERLWYAVSSRYKNNTRFRPLNSDTLATITVRGSDGVPLFNGANNGAVAVIIAPRVAFSLQSRGGINQNIASNYLDAALGEDNQDFVDGGANGFIMGPVQDVNGNTILNDQMLVITSTEMNQAMESRVLGEVRNRLVTYYAGLGNFSYPNPANFNEPACLGSVAIVAPSCTEGALVHGRIPANPTIPWGVASILRGESNNNWFQLNAWREVIHYAVAPDCVTGTANCNPAIGFLTLNSPLVLPPNNKQFVVIATGVGIAGQVRATNANKGDESNYLEGENSTPVDNIYVRTMPISIINNDKVISFP